MTDFTSVDMLAGIKAVLERENGRTELKDGMLECRLRDQFDGGQTGLARIIAGNAGNADKVSVMAWSDNPYGYAAMPDPRLDARLRFSRSRGHRGRRFEPLPVLLA